MCEVARQRNGCGHNARSAECRGRCAFGRVRWIYHANAGGWGSQDMLMARKEGICRPGHGLA